MGLNDEIYGNVRSSIIQHDPLPKIKLVFAMISKEEQHKQIANSGGDDEDAASLLQ